MAKEEEFAVSPGGQRIYKYKRREDTDIQIPEETCVYIDDIEKYLDRTFGKRDNFVYHEILSDIVHIDVHVLLPTKEDNRHILFTSGMSDIQMTLPQEFLPEYKHLERAELMMFLPAEWDIKNYNELFYWPIRLMQSLARMPHVYKSWLGYGHSIPNGPKSEHYASNTKLSGVVLTNPVGQDNYIETADDTAIMIYTIIPVYKQEMDFKLKNNADKLFEKLKSAGLSSTVDIKRKNVCSLF